MRIGDWWRRLRTFAARRRWEQDLDEEMRLHVELRARAYERGGLTADEARRAAARRFGNRTLLRERSRDAWVSSWLDSFWKDARHAVLRLSRDRAATFAVIVILAVGIGSNTAMFTVVDRVLFKPAPVAEPDDLFWLTFTETRSGRVRELSYPAYVAYTRLSGVFDGITAFRMTPLAVGGTSPYRAEGLLVSGEYFHLLGVGALIGRPLLPSDDRTPGGHPVAVISHRLWVTRYGANASILQTPIVINGRPFTIVGVAPPGFAGLEMDPAAIWLPLSMADAAMPDRVGLLRQADASWLHAVGRLRSGVSRAAAASALDGAARGELPTVARDDEARAALLPLQGGLDPHNRRESLPVFALLSMVPLLVLVVACANVGNLLLSRGLARRRELALRQALGATRRRLVRQLLIEAMTLAIVGCGAGVLFSHALTSAVVRLTEVPPEIAATLTPDLRVLTASVLLALIAGLLFGLAPALASTGASFVPAFKGADPTVSFGGRRHRLRNAFLIAQVTVAFVLVIVAGLFVQSVSKALSVHPGFDTRDAVLVSFDPELQGFDVAARERLKDAMQQDVAAIPAVERVAFTTAVPLAGRMYGTSVADPSTQDAEIQANFAGISPGYFDAMRIPLLAGRDFTRRDDRSSPPVVIVNDVLAGRLWGQISPLGRRLRTGMSDDSVHEVVGVVKGGKYDEFSEDPRAFFFVPDAQVPLGRLTLVARTAVPSSTLLGAVEQAARGAEPDMPLFDVKTLQAAVGNAVDKQRAASAVLGAFGALAMFLAAFGLYSVTAQAVTLRTREIGIRLALGARPVEVLSLFVREALRLCLTGLAVGTAASLLLSGVLGSLLYGLHPTDLLTYVATAAAFIGAAALAAAVPSARAAHADPLPAIREP